MCSDGKFDKAIIDLPFTSDGFQMSLYAEKIPRTSISVKMPGY